MLNFGLLFETGLACILSYTPGLDKGLNMYPLKYVYYRLSFIIFLCVYFVLFKVMVVVASTSIFAYNFNL